jgi:hypothetical protein
MSYSVETIPQFDKQLKRLSKKYPSLKREVAELSLSLSKTPDQGKSLGNNFYKVRLAISSKGQGKSGGARVITYLKLTLSKVYLTAIYDKSEKANISDGELDGIYAGLNQ